MNQYNHYADLQTQNPGALILTPNTSSRNSGSNNLSQVHRAQWEDYLSRFVPVENDLFSIYRNEGRMEEAAQKAGLTMGQSFGQAKTQADRQLSRYGVNLNNRQSTNRDANYALESTAAMAGARNAARTAIHDQNMNILTGMSSVTPQAQQARG